MADQHDRPAGGEMVLGLVVDPADQWAGRVEETQPAPRRLGRHRLGYAVRRKHHARIIRYFVQFVDEDRALALEVLDDVAVVDDFVAHIDRRAEPFEREFDDLDRPVDAGAKAARTGHQYG